MGAAFWLAIAALFGIAHFFWPNSSNSPSFAVLAVLLAVIGGFAVVYFTRPKS